MLGGHDVLTSPHTYLHRRKAGAFILLKKVYEKLPFMYYNVLALDCHRRSYCLDSYIAELLSSPTRAVGSLGTLTVMGNSVGCGSGL